MPAGRGDYVAYGFVVIGLIGMVAHFWIEEFGGMAWSAGTALAGIAYVMARIVSALRNSKAPPEVTLHIRLAAVNFLVAATAGFLLACDKVYHFLPGYVLSNVFAHAHLAAVGWAVMMVVGVGYRLLPMVLPAAPPRGRSVALSAMLLEAGVIVLFIGLLLRATWAPIGGLLIVSGLLAFFFQVIVMVRHPRPRPFGAVQPDYAVWHAMAAGIWLVAAMIIGLVLLFSPMSEWTLRAAVVYGVLGLVGFLSQMILGLERRLLPMYGWYWAFADTDFEAAVTPPHTMGNQRLRMLVFYLWLWGVPALAAGLFIERPLMVGAGAWALLAGVVLAAIDAITVVDALN
jgi:preprotein translocase subunit Sss1